MGKPTNNQPPQQPGVDEQNPAAVKAAEDGSNLPPPYTGASEPVQEAPKAPEVPVAAPTTHSVGTVIAQNKAAAVDDLNLPAVVDAMKVAKAETKSAIHSLIDYCVKMHPAKSQTQESIEENQIALMSALYTLLSAEDKNFDPVYKAVLAIVAANSDKCFAIRMLNRGMNTISMVKMDNRNMRFLTRTLDLLKLTVGVKNREQIMAHFDLKRLIENAPSVRIGQNLTSYYSK